MSRSVRRCLSDALSRLDAAQLRRLKEDLSDGPPGSGSTIPRAQLEGADTLDLARLLVGTYGEAEAAQVAVRALEELPERPVAEFLRRCLGSDAPAEGARGRDGADHPVLRYHRDIVQRLHSANCLLDELLSSHVVSVEQYEEVRAKPTRMEKNRALLRIVADKGSEAMDRLWLEMVKADPMFVHSLTRE
ncbi:apoptosis-associated speck-like protein containing a CARD [Narcine bancroftii]|uniref:apoptosis-associated speck-like protein containing a CARD n=1 Tax=Narcine bancroftii TaxID=1343680 RepID=UPI003831DD4D